MASAVVLALSLSACGGHSTSLSSLPNTPQSSNTNTGAQSLKQNSSITSGNFIAYTCDANQYNQAAGIGTPKGWALANAL